MWYPLIIVPLTLISLVTEEHGTNMEKKLKGCVQEARK